MQPIALSPIQAALYDEIVSLQKEQGGGPIKVRPKRLVGTASRASIYDALKRLALWRLVRVTPGPDAPRTVIIEVLPQAKGQAADRTSLMTARREMRLAAGGGSLADRPTIKDTGRFSKRWAELGLPPLGYATLCK